jgi:hypothetical protein
VTVQPHVSRSSTHLGDCVGFWLWALVGAGLVFGAISFIVFFLIPPVALLFALLRWSRWKNGPVLLGMLAGAGLPLLVVAGLQWNAWHARTIGDAKPHPYCWGGVGVCLVLAGVVSYALLLQRRRD